MSMELQGLVDALAARLQRSLVLEDRQQRMLAYSRQSGPLDDVRLESILRREATPAVVRWLRRFGIAEATDPVRLPGCQDLHMLPRVCIPIRHRDVLLGFLWFVDAEELMTDTEIETATAAREELALALYRENLARELAMQREQEALRNLLAMEATLQAYASRELIDGGHVAQSEAVTAMVAVPVRRPDAEPDESLRTAIEQGLTGVRRLLGPKRSLHLVRFDHGLLIVTTDAHSGLGVDYCAEELLAAMVSATERESGVERVAVGVGSSVPALEGTRLSYDQARLAAEVVTRLPSIGPVASWDDLGVYRVLAQLSEKDTATALLHPGLERLAEDESGQLLLETLEAYLDLAGNVHQTAQRLFLHRTTLYYRLKRIREIAGADLRDGNERLALHLGLKLARLNGRYAAGCHDYARSSKSA